jgi:hypothetical protein
VGEALPQAGLVGCEGGRLSRASKKALERLDAAVRYYGPEFLSKADMRALQRLAKRAEAAEREAEGLRRTLRFVAREARLAIDCGSFMESIGSIDEVCRAAIAPRATKDSTHERHSFVESWGSNGRVCAKCSLPPDNTIHKGLMRRATKDATRAGRGDGRGRGDEPPRPDRAAAALLLSVRRAAQVGTARRTVLLRRL